MRPEPSHRIGSTYTSPAPDAEVEAGSREAVPSGQRESADDGAGIDVLFSAHRGGDRLVRRAQPALVDHDNAPAGDHPGEADPPGRHRPHRLAHLPREIDTAVPGPVRVGGRHERVDHGGRRVEGPVPAEFRGCHRGDCGAEHAGDGEQQR